MKITEEIRFFLLAVACGAAAGAVSASIVAPAVVRDALPGPRSAATSTPPLARGGATTTPPLISLVPVERRAATPLLPPTILTQRSSAIAMIYRKPKGGAALEDRLLGADRLLGRAVALTADGWFVTSAAVVESLHVADLTIWRDGTSVAVERGVIDRVNGMAFLKTNAQGLPSPAFAQTNEVGNGAEVWVESLPDGFTPHVVVDAGARPNPNDVVSSELAVRRFVLNRLTAPGERGSAAWDPSGALVGVIESREGEETRLVPASSIASSFASLLASGEIRHAVLGVRALDLGTARFDGSRNGLPDRGALLRDDKRGGKPGVRPDSPAANADLASGDVIVRVDRDILDGTADLGEILSAYKPNASVTLRVLRDGKDLDVPVTLGNAVTSEPLK